MSLNRYSMLLLNSDKGLSRAYQKMILQKQKQKYQHKPTSQRTTTVQSDISHLRSETEYKKQSYANFIAIRNQSSYPFGQTEKRFKWQNLDDKSNLVDPNDQKNRIKRVYVKDSFQGGFVDFFNRSKNIQLSQEKKKKPKRGQSLDGNCSIKFDTIDTRRVIQPEYDNDKKDYTNARGKKFVNCDRLRHSTDGRFSSLMDKTPLTFSVRGKRKFLNSSFNNSLNLFSEDYGRVDTVRPSKKMFHEEYSYRETNRSVEYSRKDSIEGYSAKVSLRRNKM